MRPERARAPDLRGLEPVDWQERPLGELIECFDQLRVPVKESERRPGRFPYYGASGVVGTIDDYIFDGEHLLIAEDGENLRTRKSPIAFRANGKFWVNNHAHIVRGNEHADTRFLEYALQVADIDAYLTGAVMPKLTQGNMRLIPVAVPPLAEQRAIASILGALDDKIELNRRMNETLEGLARALFKSWFEPQTLPRVSAAELIESGVLEIGDGYRAKNTELGAPGLPFVRAADLNGGFDTDGAAVLHNDSVSRAGSKVSRLGDVAFTSKGTIGRIARVGPYVHPFVYSPQVCYWRTLDSSKLAPAVLYCWMSTDDFRRQVDVVADQTDMAPYVSLRDQRAMRVPIFGEAQHALDRQVAPLLARVSTNVAQSRTLAALRDALLPKLLSGELSVRDAERAVEATP